MKEKGENMLRLNPSERLAFQPPFDKVSETKMLLANTSAEVICFKIKTTAPKR